MRYYNIIISDPSTNAILQSFTSMNGTTPDPNALMVELDVSVTAFSEPFGASYVRIWGVGIQQIGQSNNLNPAPDGSSFKQIQIYAGMSKGLPLANPQQQGLIVQGLIQQAFGNWQGTEQTLDLVIIAGDQANPAQANLSLHWLAGTQLSTVIKQTLAVAFPSYKSVVNISPNLVLSNDEPGFYGTVTQLAQYIYQISQQVINSDTYQGVRIFLKENTFIVDDATTQTTPIVIAFQDLVGQPTWLGPNQITFTTVLRADISVSDYVKLPPNQATTTAQSYALYRQNSIFQGSFYITSARHVGNSRSTDASDWVTTFVASTLGTT